MLMRLEGPLWARKKPGHEEVIIPMCRATKPMAYRWGHLQELEEHRFWDCS